jgi:hypothetical protein
MDGTIISSANDRLNSARLPGGLLQGTASEAHDMDMFSAVERDKLRELERMLKKTRPPPAVPVVGDAQS